MPSYISPSVNVNFKKHNGGLNSTAGPLGLEENESSDLQNVDFDKFGSFYMRQGYTALNPTAVGTAPIDGLHWYMSSSQRKPTMMTGTKAYRMDDLDGTWDDITGGVTITGGYKFRSTTFLSTQLSTNNYDPPIIWTGTGDFTTMTVPTGLTRARFISHFQNYCLLANCVVSGVAQPTRFYFSTIKTIDTWDDADFYEVGKDDGEEITGFKVLADRIVIYKLNSIYCAYFTGDVDIPFIIQKTNSAVGCIAPDSIQEVDNGHIFLSYDGIYYFDGANSYKMSDRISTTLQGYAKAYYPYAVSLYQKTKNRYWLALATSTTNDRVITWDSHNNAWSVYTGLAPSVMTTFLIDGVEECPYFGDYAGRVYRADTGQSDYPLNVKTAINSYFWTNWKNYDDICDQKGIPHAYIYHKDQAGTLDFAYAYDFVNTAQYSTTFTTTSGSGYDTAITRQDLTGRGRVVRFRFGMNTTDSSYQIDGLGTEAHLETNK
jgi:hypothetical protein